MTTPVEELRAAATKVRETAAKATPGPWETDGPYWWDSNDCTTVITTAPSRRPVTIMPRFAESDGRREETAAWIALASPLIAEPIAAWLERAADHLCCTSPAQCADVNAALAVARQILGTTS